MGSLSDWDVEYKLVRDQHSIKRASRKGEAEEKQKKWLLGADKQLATWKGNSPDNVIERGAWVGVGGGACIDVEHCEKKNVTEHEEEWQCEETGKNASEGLLLNGEVHFLPLWPLCYSTGRTLTLTHPLRLMFH